ncbi:MAG: nucleoside hydrolase [Candidatus Dormiibacterota bacterium]
MTTKRILLDTDLGTDVDDCLALAFLVQSPEVRLEAVTCVYADVELRGRMVAKLLRLADLPDVPVALGARQPLLGRVPLFWQGHEGEGLLEAGDPAPVFDRRHAATLIVDVARAHPGEVWLLAIGPLTNVALALQLEPRLPDLLAGVSIMGGAIRGRAEEGQAAVEHNVRCDPEAAYLVLRSGLPITLAPLDVTTQVRIDRAGLARIAQGGSPFHDAVAQQLARYPRFRDRGWTYLHDALAAATIVRPDLVSTSPFEIDVDLGGDVAGGLTVARPVEPAQSRRSLRVALDVAVERFQDLFLERLAAPR